MRSCVSLVHRRFIPSFRGFLGPNPCSLLYYRSYIGQTWNYACTRSLFVPARRWFTQVKLFPNLIASPRFLIKLRSSDLSALFLDTKPVFTAGVNFRSGGLSDPSPSLVNCQLSEYDVPGLKAAYYQASYSPLGELSGDCFAFFLLELRVDLGVNNPVVLVLLLISPYVRMAALPAKPLCFLLLLLCIEVSKSNLLL
jgi:hypothetical protein